MENEIVWWTEGKENGFENWKKFREIREILFFKNWRNFEKIFEKITENF